MVFPQPFTILRIASQAPLPGASEVQVGRRSQRMIRVFPPDKHKGLARSIMRQEKM
jgi:hypothetical protein